jgi:anti-sigma regulatory factor (Ser/Thr protein kinase)
LVAARSICTHNAEVRPISELNEATLQSSSLAAEPSLPSELPVASPILMPATEHNEALPVEWRKEFEFSGVLAMVPEHREQVMGFVDLHCADEGDRIDWLVAVQEALANAALHGCHDEASKMIRCVVSVTATEITIAVRDPGPGFPMERADPEKYQVTKLSHGRGIVLMRSLVDEVTFAHNGAEVVLRKHLARKSD